MQNIYHPDGVRAPARSLSVRRDRHHVQMSPDWDEVGYVISSTYRVAVLQRLAEGPATPSRIAETTDFSLAHVSRALQDLRSRSLVELLVSEDRKKGRVYGITDHGQDVWSTIKAENLV